MRVQPETLSWVMRSIWSSSLRSRSGRSSEVTSRPDITIITSRLDRSAPNGVWTMPFFLVGGLQRRCDLCRDAQRFPHRQRAAQRLSRHVLQHQERPPAPSRAVIS